MPLDELEPWLLARAERHPVATSLPMLDGYVAAIVAGPVSISPLDWMYHGAKGEILQRATVARMI